MAGKKRDEVRASLPENLRPIFDQLVDEYKFHCIVLYGKDFVSYGILGELIKDGWRPSARAKEEN